LPESPDVGDRKPEPSFRVIHLPGSADAMLGRSLPDEFLDEAARYGARRTPFRLPSVLFV
jgi:hypothetical protein